MIAKLCCAPGCEELASDGPHCAEHAVARVASERRRRAAAQGSQRAQRNRALYADPKWIRAAKAYLKRHPLCVDCLDLGAVVPATEVDHITPHDGDRTRFWDRSNWQALCKPCHSRKTAREVLNPKGGVSEK